MIPGYLELEFPLLERLADELQREFEALDAMAMSEANLGQIPDDAQGVYELFHHGALAYIGKTDADAGLGQRLARHRKKLRHRHGITPNDVGYKAIRLYTFTALDLEAELIRRHGGTACVPWNGSGFGANDPGRERDTTTYKDDHFDKRFPIDIDRPLDLDVSSCGTVGDVLVKLKDHVPYVIRFARDGRKHRPHPDLMGSVTRVGRMKGSCRSLLAHVVPALPRGWRLHALPSHLVLYDDTRQYRGGELIAQGAAERRAQT
ncbi:MAG: GIY-YIG nuclease family protein [Pseudomonadota bacterium]